ncbi:MAG: exodeoxyribonuclease VII large subunit [Methanoregula sp.]|nr:MAG: exodeoxyribonuclease VII large subunit [Methanoregula sp.]
MDWFYSTDNTLAEKPGERHTVDGKTAPLRVSEVSAIIESLLDDERLQEIWVRGEITKYTRSSRGHCYFTLAEGKGANILAVISCVMWRSDADRLSFTPSDGMEVIVSGSVAAYAPQGRYQLKVHEILQAGIGEKYLLIEQWKKELAAEGCFAGERKRPLPPFPLKVGVVTSETGAVVHDIRTVISRRFAVEIIISPTLVQGEDAHRQIAQAIHRLKDSVDVVIIARGGGSFEDLFPFNHPDVVRAIAACPVPVVSAIGHEVDVTLADLASDIRAATPSAAAELVVPDKKVLQVQITEIWCHLGTLLIDRISQAKTAVSDLRDRLRPQRFTKKIDEKQQVCADLADRLERAFATRIEREWLLLSEMTTSLVARNPLAVLARGFCVAEKDGMLVKSVDTVVQGDRLRIRFYNGRSHVIVERVEHDGNI